MNGSRQRVRQWRWGDWRRQTGVRALLVTALCRLLGLVIRPSPRGGQPLPSGHLLAFVVIKPLALGDVLLTTPFLDALRRAYPQAHVTYAVGDYARPALANNPHIDDVLPMGRLGVPRSYDLRAYAAFVRALRARRFDAAFVLDRSPLMALLPYLAGIPYRIGLHSRGRGFAHTTRVPVREGQREAEEYLRVALAAGVPPQGARSHFYPTPRDIEAMRRLIQEFGLARVGPLVVCAPGGGVNAGAIDVAKRWPPDRFARVADALISQLGAAVALAGLPSDASSIAAVRRAMHYATVDFGGQTSLGQLAALIELSDLFVGNDSLGGHLAACVGTPSVTVFTTTSGDVYAPYAPSARWVQAEPDGTGGRADVDAVIRAALLALRDWRGDPADERLHDRSRRRRQDGGEP